MKNLQEIELKFHLLMRKLDSAGGVTIDGKEITSEFFKTCLSVTPLEHNYVKMDKLFIFANRVWEELHKK